jgi:hypothetical protein
VRSNSGEGFKRSHRFLSFQGHKSYGRDCDTVLTFGDGLEFPQEFNVEMLQLSFSNASLREKDGMMG